MRTTRAWVGGLIVAGLGLMGLGAVPAAPGYHEIEQTIAKVREAWRRPGARPQRYGSAWNAYFDTLLGELRAYTTAQTENDQLRALGRLYQMSRELGTVSWDTAAALREELRAWLRPRVRLAWAQRRLVETIQRMPAANEPQRRSNREGWVRFARDELGPALRAYEAAPTVADRRAAMTGVYNVLNALHAANQAHPWPSSQALETAMNDLFNRPNLDVTADVTALSAALNQNVVESGPVFFKGEWSYVTAGPKTGFGLLPSDRGIAFYNSQLLTSVTPITRFQRQIEADPQGQRAAKLYYFDATSVDNSELTIIAELRPDGLHLTPSYKHNVSASVGSEPQPGNGLGRAVASLIGFNQKKITRKVWEGAIGQIQQGVVEGAAELGSIRVAKAEAQRNAQIRKFLIGGDQLAYRDFLIKGLTLRSQPQYARGGGTVTWRGAKLQVGADAPQPAQFETFQPGVTADIHLTSLMTNLARGYLQSLAAQNIENIMIVTKKVPPGTPPREGIETARNVDFETFSKAVETARAANDPKMLAIRIKWPGEAPEFGADAQGHLVALVHDLAVEVPAPPQAARGGGLTGPPARIYMLVMPRAEFDIEFQVHPAKGKTPVRLEGRVVGFDPGPGARVYAINEDEKNPVQVNAFTATIILRVFGVRLQGQPVDWPLGELNLRNYTLASVSPLDPSGWIRFILTPTFQASPPQIARPRAVASR
jgi:hypothetical protein